MVMFHSFFVCFPECTWNRGLISDAFQASLKKKIFATQSTAAPTLDQFFRKCRNNNASGYWQPGARVWPLATTRAAWQLDHQGESHRGRSRVTSRQTFLVCDHQRSISGGRRPSLRDLEKWRSHFQCENCENPGSPHFGSRLILWNPGCLMLEGYEGLALHGRVTVNSAATSACEGSEGADTNSSGFTTHLVGNASWKNGPIQKLWVRN